MVTPEIGRPLLGTATPTVRCRVLIRPVGWSRSSILPPLFKISRVRLGFSIRISVIFRVRFGFSIRVRFRVQIWKYLSPPRDADLNISKFEP